jgi:hypothetical protein
MQCETLARLHGPFRPSAFTHANAGAACWLAYLSCEAESSYYLAAWSRPSCVCGLSVLFDGAIEVFGGSGHRSIPRAYMRKLMHIQCSKTYVSQRSDGFEHGALRIGIVQEAYVPGNLCQLRTL